MKAEKAQFQKLHQRVHAHAHHVWPDRKLEGYSWGLGPISESMPEFRVFQMQPATPDQSWVYLSSGMSMAVQAEGVGLELFVLSPVEEVLHVELLAMLAHYGCEPTRPEIGLHSILNLGRPWLEGSACEHLLISLPYTLGPRVEWMESEGEPKTRILWLLPITAQEAAFARQHGVEALEQEFDRHKINPVDPNRPSVVP